MKKIAYFLMAGILLASCVEETTVETDKVDENSDTTEVQETKIDYPTDPKFNDFARFIAGQEGGSNSSLKELESSSTWTTYRTSLDALWKKTNDKLPTIREWSKKELSDINKDGGTLFYPFAGADFLHADLFFPEHDNIAMIALEPIGNFPDIQKKATEGTLETYMGQLKKSMHAILGLSFFRTIAMADDFQTEMDGTLHVLMHFMARTDHEVMYQEKVAILPDGSLTNELDKAEKDAYIGNRFYFRKNGEEKVKTLTYFAINMANDAYGESAGLGTRKDAMAYFKSLNIKSTYLKSASYLLHRETFSMIRDLILSESEHVLQDDSAIPLAFFKPAKWNLTYYGTYTVPISLFASRHQEDLKQAYLNTANDVRDLPFGIGYQYHNGTSNMMRASKK